MKLYLIAIQMLYYLVLLPWIYFWGKALVLTMHVPTPQNTILLSLAGLYPIAVIVCTIVSWYLHLDKRSVSIAVNLIPAIWLIVAWIY